MGEQVIFYNPNLKKFARKLRKHSTLGEVILWNILKKKQLVGYDFHRQKPIGKYIVDFYCPKLKLIIEVDGSTHDFKQENDIQRQEYMEKIGLEILRFTESDVRFRLGDVEQAIRNRINEVIHT